MLEITDIRRRTWAEIDMDAALYNFNIVKSYVTSKICCVIKANAYGHGASELAKLYQDNGANFLAVSNIEEAMQLRNNGIVSPILILGYTPAGCASILAEHNISQCIYSYEYGKELSDAAAAAGVKVRIHLKLDTGMGRIGFLCRDTGASELDTALAVCRFGSLIPEGIFTHFAVADESSGGEEYTRTQYKCFVNGIGYLRDSGTDFEIRHCSNSAAIFDYPEYEMDMVRAGIVLYGLKPSGAVRRFPELKPVMSLRSVVSHIKNLSAGECVGYGRAYTASCERRIATVPIGYADGFWRSNGNQRYHLALNGRQAEIVGRVCMDQLMIDVSTIECSVGDIVDVFGTVKGNTVDDIASVNGTINYEILCSVGERVPKAYIKDGKIVKWKDILYNP